MIKTIRRYLIGLALFCAACGAQPQVIELTGQTMGSTYNIVVVDRAGEMDRVTLQSAIDETLALVNARFSNWDSESEVSRFNRLQTTAPVPISEDFREVMEIAYEVHAASEGQFDVTLAPLVELWGFGAPGPSQTPPSDAAIAAVMESIGQTRALALENEGPQLRKTVPTATIYLAAIAKGYGIDKVAETIASLGAEDYMVEIGGDLVAAGVNPSGQAWRIGVERPDAINRRVEEIVEISGLGMATSGDYRNYFEENGVRYSHIIDAETGRPVTHTTASVTVLAQTGALADAWATALLVLGAERGMSIAEKHDIGALFIVRRQDDAEAPFDLIPSSRFADLQSANED
ncbi:MAG: FAD:protein FMN transferase [Pseudomonadota bacterium]